MPSLFLINSLHPHAVAALQGHAPQHALHNTLCTPDGSLPQAVVAVSVEARSTVTFLRSSGSSNSSSTPLPIELRLAAVASFLSNAPRFHTCRRSRNLALLPLHLAVHPPRCPDSLPLLPSPVSTHVCSSNCKVFLPDTEFEVHDYRESSSIGDALVVDLLQLDRVQILRE